MLTGLAIMIGGSIVPRAIAQDNPQTEPPKIIRKSAAVLEVSAIKRGKAVYPAGAKVTGAIVVEVTVDENGNVIFARTLSGHPLLMGPALAAARGWKFSPTQLSGVPVKVIGTLTFNFSPPADSTGPDNADDKDIEQAKQAVKANAYSPEAHVKLAEAYVAEDMYDK